MSALSRLWQSIKAKKPKAWKIERIVELDGWLYVTATRYSAVKGDRAMCQSQIRLCDISDSAVEFIADVFWENCALEWTRLHAELERPKQRPEMN